MTPRQWVWATVCAWAMVAGFLFVVVPGGFTVSAFLSAVVLFGLATGTTSLAVAVRARERAEVEGTRAKMLDDLRREHERLVAHADRLHAEIKARRPQAREDLRTLVHACEGCRVKDRRRRGIWPNGMTRSVDLPPPMLLCHEHHEVACKLDLPHTLAAYFGQVPPLEGAARATADLVVPEGITVWTDPATDEARDGDYLALPEAPADVTGLEMVEVRDGARPAKPAVPPWPEVLATGARARRDRLADDLNVPIEDVIRAAHVLAEHEHEQATRWPTRPAPTRPNPARDPEWR